MRLFLKKRTKEGRERYYKISIFKNLFGEIILTREYGNIANKGPTGTIEEVLFSPEQAEAKALNIFNLKKNSGYQCVN